MESRVTQLFSSHIEASIALADHISAALLQAGTKITETLLADGKVLLCAPGRSYANGLHFMSMLFNHDEAERPPLPIVMLGQSMMTGHRDGSDHAEQVYAREIQALAQPQDVLLILTLSMRLPALLQALLAAQEKGMSSIVVVGEAEMEGLTDVLGPQDMCLVLPVSDRARVLELQLVVLHGLRDVIDGTLFAM